MKDLVLFYHANCSDGFGAAYSFWKKFGNEIDMIPLGHYDRADLNLEDYRDKIVYMADICLEREDLLKLNSIAKKLVVLDHHKSAQEDVGDLDFCIFDMNKSGSVLAWEYLFDTPVPYLLRCIEDRDIWRWNVKLSREVNLFCDSQDRTFESWDLIVNECETNINDVARIGSAIQKFEKRQVEIVNKSAFLLEIKGYTVPTINSPLFRSIALADLAVGVPFSAGYHFDGEYYIFSLRSDPNGIDVTKIAQMFPGGGGHYHAAGFSTKSLEDIK
jgi:nanoRNase/pAp phosphatase (c-di-AMP/oligoRNAs hydrolase)